jgi:hypothetical protein
MDISQEDARRALADVQNTVERTRRALEDDGASTLLIVWGAIWTLGFLMGHFQPDLASRAWLVFDMVGIVVTFIVVKRSRVKTPELGRLAVFCLLLFVYGFVWLMVIGAASPRPVTVTGEQLAAFICSLVMFASVVMGLWLRSPLFLWLGLAVTALAVAALFLLHAQFYLVMAVVGGPALIGSGIYVRRRWR